MVSSRRVSGQLPPILTAEQTAELLHLASGEEALKMARGRKIPSVKVGRRRLFILEDLIQSLRKQSDKALTDDQL